MFGFCETVSLVSAQGAVPLTFVGCDKSKQKHACACSPKVLKITSRLSASPLLRDSKLISATYLILYQSVILRFLLSALHRLLTELLYLKQPFLSVSANRYRFNQSVLVCAPLRGAVLFMNCYSDIR